MTKICGILALIGILLWLGLAGAAPAAEISPDNRELFYSGRIDFSKPAAPVWYWPGTSVTISFKGTAISATLDDAQGNNCYQTIIDGKDQKLFVIKTKAGPSVYHLASGLPAGKHTVVLFRRTGISSGRTVFKGFTVDGEILPSPKPSDRRIEFYGDSITVGFHIRDDAPEDGSKIPESGSNNYLSYDAVTARRLGADYRCIAQTGMGLMKGFVKTTMPEMYSRLDPDDEKSVWDFSRWTPQVVVINVLQNDCSLAQHQASKSSAKNPPSSPPQPEAIVKAYTAWVSALRAKYPEAHIICALGNMDASAEGSPWIGYLEKSVEQLRAAGDKKIYACIFPYKNTPKHPDAAEQRAMADKLVPLIQSITGWQ